MIAIQFSFKSTPTLLVNDESKLISIPVYYWSTLLKQYLIF